MSQGGSLGDLSLVSASPGLASPGLASRDRMPQGGAPRYFLAFSDNWKDPDASQTRMRRPLSALLEPEHDRLNQRTAPRPSYSREEKSGTTLDVGPAFQGAPNKKSTVPTNVKSALVGAVKDYLSDSIGASHVHDILSTLPEEQRELLSGVVIPLAWFPLPLLDRLLHQASRYLAVGEDPFAFSAGAGAYAASRNVPTMHRLVLQTATPATAVHRIPQLWRAYHDSGTATVQETHTGAWQVEITDAVPDSPLHTSLLGGYYARFLEMVGAKNVRSTVLSSCGRGDRKTVISLRWR